jgi:hypothetical protein
LNQVTISEPFITGIEFLILTAMKKLLYICILFAGNATAQVQPQQLDSILRPAKTDSADFSNPAYKKDSSSAPAGNQPMRRDSLPMDDRKPKTPPKK